MWEYSEVFDHIVEVPRHQYSTVSYDTMVDPDVTALPLVSWKDFEKETHVYRNLLHMTDWSPDPSKWSRQITSMAINCNDKRAWLEHVWVQADIFFSGWENEYLEHDPNVPWKDPKKNKAHSLAWLIQEVIRSMQELEELMRSDVFGPTKKKPVFQEVLDRLLCILYDRV